MIQDGVAIKEGNDAGDGGGVKVFLGDTLTVSNSIVQKNRSKRLGGWYFRTNSPVKVIDSAVTDNQSPFGGGIQVSGVGAIDSLVIARSSISDNTSTGSGGGIAMNEGVSDVTIVDSTINGNVASQWGGGIFAQRNSPLVVVNTTAAGNRANLSGGGISTLGGVLAIQSTITNNSANSLGGGIELDNGEGGADLTSINSVIAGNVASSRVDVAENGGNSLIRATSSFFGSAVVIDTDNGGNTNGGPNGTLADAKLLPLGNNGGDVLTAGLDVGSPLVNAGNNTATFPSINEVALGVDINGDGDALDSLDSIDDLLTDARGANFSRVTGSQVDIGAHEFRETSSLIVTTPSDVVDETDSVTSLREAINYANRQASADTITFDPNVFAGGANSLIRLGGSELVISQPVTIDGTTGTDIVITGDASADDTTTSGTFITDLDQTDADDLDDNSRVFMIDAGDTTLRGLTITGGFVNAAALIGGGGIHARSSGTLTLDQSSVSGNFSSLDGGGISARAGSVTFTDSTVSANHSYLNGGGVFTRDSAVTLTDSTVIGNQSGFDGGGLFTRSGALTLTGRTLSGNQAGDEGGGVFTDTDLSGVTTVITNSTISGNRAGDVGGGIFNIDGLTQIFHSTVTDNQAAVGGGVGTFGNSTARTEVGSTIIAGNTATTAGSDVSSQGVADTDNSFMSLGFNLIGDGQFQTVDFFSVTNTMSDLVGTTASPLHPQLGPLSDNGGPTHTHALPPGSLAIDAGDPNFDVNGPDGVQGTSDDIPFDQRGTGFGRVRLNRVDIGAFERQPDMPSLVVTTIQDVDSNTDGLTSLREAIAYANSGATPADTDGDPETIDTITFDASQSGQTIYLSAAGNELVISSSLTIDGDINSGGTPDMTISADSVSGADDADSRVFTIDSSTNDAIVTLAGLVIQDGNVVGGGGGHCGS